MSSRNYLEKLHLAFHLGSLGRYKAGLYERVAIVGKGSGGQRFSFDLLATLQILLPEVARQNPAFLFHDPVKDSVIPCKVIEDKGFSCLFRGFDLLFEAHGCDFLHPLVVSQNSRPVKHSQGQTGVTLYHFC
jgi:hypothetical protein